MKTHEVRVDDAVVVLIEQDEQEHSAGDTVGKQSPQLPTDPPALVLVHGIGMGAQYFANLAEELSTYARVVSVELPGFGESPTPDERLTLVEMGHILSRALRQYGLSSVNLIGHSMGTQVVVEAALADPKLVSELVLIAPTVNRHERNVSKQALRMIQDLFGEDLRVILIGFKYYLKTGPRWFVLKLRSMLLHKVENVLPDLTQRALVLRGEHDRVCPTDWVSEVADLIPDSVMKELPGVGHETMVADPEDATAEIVAFLGLSPRG